MSFLCSTMIPSFKRPVLLMAAIDSFRKTAKDPKCHQAIVRLSEADPSAEKTKLAVETMFENVKVIIGRQMGGYCALGLYYDEMLPLCDGEFINIWDDDMTIEGPWDDELRKAPKKAMIVCERYQLGPSLYEPGSLDGSGTGWFAHQATWREAGGTSISIHFPPDAYMVAFAQSKNWIKHQMRLTVLNHNWQRPTDGDR